MQPSMFEVARQKSKHRLFEVLMLAYVEHYEQ